VTLRQLLNHTSGIAGANAADQGLEFTPGTRISYSNTGYIVLGQIIEKVCGKPYEAVLQERIFRPLGMNATGYDHPEVVLEHRAAGYSAGTKGGVENAGHIDMAGPFAAGGLYSTVEDLSLFDQALNGEKLLKTATWDQAFTPTTLSDGRTVPYGLGWMVQPYRGLKEVAHGGDITGFNSYLARYPEQRFTVIVLSNLSMRPPGPLPTALDLAHRIADIYLGDKMPPAETPKVAAVDPGVFRAYAGQYRLAGPAEILEVTGDNLLVTWTEGKLFVEGKQGKYEMVPESERTFRIPQFGTGVTFHPDDKGQVNEMVVTVMGLKELAATRVQ
jgi:CubicO group peptidase (beta-lactamase class C family)